MSKTEAHEEMSLKTSEVKTSSRKNRLSLWCSAAREESEHSSLLSASSSCCITAGG